MAVITISRRRSMDECVYEIDDFGAYVDALRKTGIEAPKAKYRITIPDRIEQEIHMSDIDIGEQVALFFRLGAASGLEYQIVDQQ